MSEINSNKCEAFRVRVTDMTIDNKKIMLKLVHELNKIPTEKMWLKEVSDDILLELFGYQCEIDGVDGLRPKCVDKIIYYAPDKDELISGLKFGLNGKDVELVDC